ncbi:hypothetical protein, partial [Helicobacter pylori]|uniref:hypothetical protein n=1 Tax=Helicobacter pylori TaxID=210 RepID=UPI0019699641
AATQHEAKPTRSQNKVPHEQKDAAKRAAWYGTPGKQKTKESPILCPKLFLRKNLIFKVEL